MARRYSAILIVIAACHAAAPPAAPAHTPAAGPAPDWDHELGGSDVPLGCIASTGAEALCIEVTASIQDTTRVTLAWLSERGREEWPGPTQPAQTFNQPLALDPALRARVVARLRAGHFVAIGAPVAEANAQTPERPALAAGPARVTWTGQVLTQVDGGDGSWPRTREIVHVAAPKACDVVSAEREGIEFAELRAWALGANLLVEIGDRWGLEGDRGSSTRAALVSAGAPCPRLE